MGGQDKRKLDRRDTRRLVRAAYAVSFPYLLLVVGGILIALWLITMIFRT